MAKKDYGTKFAWLIFVCALGISGTWATGIGKLFWQPPKPSELSEATGRFEPHSWVSCSTPYCSQKPYVLVTQGGQRLDVNCETAPALNQCLDGDKYNRKVRDIAGEASHINYYDAASKSAKNRFYIVMTAKYKEQEILSYSESVSRLKNSTILYGDSLLRSGVTVGYANVGSDIINRNISWFLLGCLSLSALNLIIRTVKKAFKL